jgi:hypothetical protein
MADRRFNSAKAIACGSGEERAVDESTQSSSLICSHAQNAVIVTKRAFEYEGSNFKGF